MHKCHSPSMLHPSFTWSGYLFGCCSIHFSAVFFNAPSRRLFFQRPVKKWYSPQSVRGGKQGTAYVYDYTHGYTPDNKVPRVRAHLWVSLSRRKICYYSVCIHLGTVSIFHQQSLFASLTSSTQQKRYQNRNIYVRLIANWEDLKRLSGRILVRNIGKM